MERKIIKQGGNRILHLESKNRDFVNIAKDVISYPILTYEILLIIQNHPSVVKNYSLMQSYGRIDEIFEDHLSRRQCVLLKKDVDHYVGVTAKASIRVVPECIMIFYNMNISINNKLFRNNTINFIKSITRPNKTVLTHNQIPFGTVNIIFEESDYNVFVGSPTITEYVRDYIE